MLFSSFPHLGAEVQGGWGALWGRAAEVGEFHQGKLGQWVLLQTWVLEPVCGGEANPCEEHFIV